MVVANIVQSALGDVTIPDEDAKEHESVGDSPGTVQHQRFSDDFDYLVAYGDTLDLSKYDKVINLLIKAPMFHWVSGFGSFVASL